ncbi:MAG TPA: hypothetical protein VMH86_05165 [Rhizomicrobium sp.]|nr:hypothetical protein [Rhizomicrobium sp.]
MRVLIAGLLGAVAMFAWTAVAHVATPLGTIGFSQLPNEARVENDLQSGTAKSGLYIFPWVDPGDPKMMEKSSALMKVHGSGYLVYHPPGAAMEDPANMAAPLAVEFLKQLVQATVAAFLVSMMAGLGFLGRLGAVTLTGVIAGIATNVSYWNWYGYPLDYTVAQAFVEIVSAFASGLAIAWWLGRTAKPAAAS